MKPWFLMGIPQTTHLNTVVLKQDSVICHICLGMARETWQCSGCWPGHQIAQVSVWSNICGRLLKMRYPWRPHLAIQRKAKETTLQHRNHKTPLEFLSLWVDMSELVWKHKEERHRLVVLMLWLIGRASLDSKTCENYPLIYKWVSGWGKSILCYTALFYYKHTQLFPSVF